jgi:hypothetical protein
VIDQTVFCVGVDQGTRQAAPIIGYQCPLFTLETISAASSPRTAVFQGGAGKQDHFPAPRWTPPPLIVDILVRY